MPQEFNLIFWNLVFCWWRPHSPPPKPGFYGISKTVAAQRALRSILKILDLWDKKDVQSRMLSGGK